MDKDQIYIFWQLIYLIDFMYIRVELLYNIHGHYFLRKDALNLHFVLIEEVKTNKDLLKCLHGSWCRICFADWMYLIGILKHCWFGVFLYMTAV